MATSRGPARGGDRRPAVSVVVPAYNEEAGLAVVLSKLLPLLDEGYEVIVVDDGSTDGTAAVARAFPCRVLSLERNRGKGAALRSGIEAARGESVIWLDADDTYPVDRVPLIAKALAADYDLVYASRAGRRDRIPNFNRIGNALFSWSIRRFYGFVPKDPCTGLCGVRRRYLASMRLHASGFAIESEIAMKAGRMKLRMLEMPIEYGERIGTPKLSGPKAGTEITLSILRHLLWRPRREAGAVETAPI